MRLFEVAMATGLVMDGRFALHDTGEHPECPERLAAVERGLREAGLMERVVGIGAREARDEELELVHDPAYVALVRRESAAGRPALSTGDTVMSAGSLEAALLATGGVLAAVEAVVGGRVSNAFCAVRPPGHHATPSAGMGFCFFNHVAVATRYAQRRLGIGRVLIVDWDVHHGNGTQDAFYEDGSVLFFSSHQFPWYPGTGRRDETGRGAGLGLTINAPLPAGSGVREIVGEMEGRLEKALAGFRPELVMVSAGFDSRVGDPLGRFELTDADFAELTRRVMGYGRDYAGGRVLSVLEGGYNPGTLGGAAAAHVGALVAAG
ncbi:MAG TPA: histone deacetylase [Phycisphaerae bacterium]|nr:histone deacetylase [Phycisphaerae bacterium]